MITHTLGFPRIGSDRQLKQALEAFWKGQIGQDQLLDAARQLRRDHWRLQRDLGIDCVPVGDFAFYDQMLTMIAMLGAAPARFHAADPVDLDSYFAMARGVSGQRQAHAMEMTKWFDTNYHYIVPEFSPGQTFHLACDWLFDQVEIGRAHV